MKRKSKTATHKEPQPSAAGSASLRPAATLPRKRSAMVRTLCQALVAAAAPRPLRRPAKRKGDGTVVTPTDPGLPTVSARNRSIGLHRFFLPYQADFIRDDSSLVIVEKGRQIGLSYAAAYKAVRLVSQRNARLDVWVASRDEIQARQFLLYCKRWARTLNYAAESHEQHLLLNSGKAVQVQVLKFANDLCIYCLSSSPDAIVGKTGHVMLDEFALHKDQRQLYAVAKPVTQWGGTLTIISTHRGVGTVFNELVTDVRRHGNKMGWSLHSIPIQKAVEQGIVEKIDTATGGQWTERLKATLRKTQPPINQLNQNSNGVPSVSEPPNSQTLSNRPNAATRSPSPRFAESAEQNGERAGVRCFSPPYCGDEGKEDVLHNEISGPTLNEKHPLRTFWLQQQRAECIDEEQWLQEYCCTPADESAAFITYEMIAACEDADTTKDFPYLAALPSSANLYIGFDVARTNDLSVIDVEEKIGDVFWERLRIELKGKTFAEQEFELRRLLDLPALKRCCIDATGMGMQLAENMVNRYRHRVEAVRFTGPVKEELAFPLRAAHEDRTLRYRRDERLRADLRGVKKESTASGNIRFAGESADSHCDRFWAKALALHAGKTRANTMTVWNFNTGPDRPAVLRALNRTVEG